MSKRNRRATVDKTSRRAFIKRSSLLFAGGAVGGPLSVVRSAHAFGSDAISVGLIGCGRRGTGAAVQALNTSKNTQPEGAVLLSAMADAFGDRLHAAHRAIKGQHPQCVDVPRERRFVGLRAYQQLLETDVDLVILATPPGFRPTQFEAAVNAGKHVFMEKPVATDAPGARRVLAANEEARSRGLAVAVGLQRHHEKRYQETIRRLQEGAIGEVLLARAYWNAGRNCARPRQKRQTELEYQMRNWHFFNWLSGDHIVEQHIHNLDVINWLKRGYPVGCNGIGGRQFRTTHERGQIFDHHFVEFTYADGAKMYSQCRQMGNCWSSVAEHARGTKGKADISGAKIYDVRGNLTWQHGRGGANGHQEQLDGLFAALRLGETPNEGEYGAKSTLTAIMGRTATYSGHVITWDRTINSNVSLADCDSLSSFDDASPVVPGADGQYPVSHPGIT